MTPEPTPLDWTHVLMFELEEALGPAPRRDWMRATRNIRVALEAAEVRGARAMQEAAAKLVDRESHSAGAQGYSGEPKHTDYRATAKRIRAIDPAGVVK